MKRHSQEPQFVPLNQLKKSPRNVRQVPHTSAYIESLADSIHAHGQLQNCIVEPEQEEGKATGCYWVSGGEARRLAQVLRVKRKQIPKDHPIPCLIDTEHDARELSTAENVFHEPMHPADEFEAFKTLVDSGRSIDEVAARFGVTPLVVQRRLKLANVAPDFIALYREGEIALDILMTLAITDDHAKQKQAWVGLSKHNRHCESLRQALTEGELSRRDPLVKFVGMKAYEKAGGAVRRDLFAEQEEDGFILDIELLRKLAMDKLKQQAAKLEKEGHAWVEIIPNLDYATRSTYGRVHRIPRPATSEEQAALDSLLALARAHAARKDPRELRIVNGANFLFRKFSFNQVGKLAHQGTASSSVHLFHLIAKQFIS